MATAKQPSRSTRTATKKTGRAKAQPDKGAASRLGKGELQAQVLDALQRHAGEELTGTQLAKALDRSAGAIGNALAKFAKDEESRVVQTSTKPRRYSIPKNGKGRPRAKR